MSLNTSPRSTKQVGGCTMNVFAAFFKTQTLTIDRAMGETPWLFAGWGLGFLHHLYEPLVLLHRFDPRGALDVRPVLAGGDGLAHPLQGLVPIAQLFERVRHRGQGYRVLCIEALDGGNRVHCFLPPLEHRV